VTDLELNLCGIPFAIHIDGPISAASLEARFGAYRTTRCGLPVLSPPASLRVTLTEGWRPPRPSAVPFPGAEGEALPDGTVRFFRDHEHVTWDPARRVATAERSTRVASPAAYVDVTPIDTPLRLVLSHELPAQGGVLVHGAGYGDDRGAVVFLAPSTGGKTTTTRKLPEANVLSDDQVALRRIDGVWYAFALPFVGDYAKPTTPRVTRLRALVLLEKSPTLSLTRLGGARALVRVMNCVVRFVRGAGGADLLALAGDLVGSTPVHVLALSRDEPVMPLVERLL
jgi:hypothetical protein